MALANVDPIIELIKASSTPDEAQTALTSKLWKSELVAEMAPARMWTSCARTALARNTAGSRPKKAYRLTDVQAKAILEMRLQRLTAMESDKVIAEYKEVIETVRDLLDILAAER